MKTLLLLLLATGSRASTITTVAGKVSPASNASNVIAGVAGQDIAPSKVTATSSVTASGFFGDGSGLTGVTGTDASRVLKAGDTMTGPLMISNSTLTVTGNAFSVGVSTLVVTGGRVGIGTTSPAYRLEVAGTSGTSGHTRLGASIDYGSAMVLSVAPGVVSFDAPGVVGGRLAINSSGNVGLGTNTPGTKLHVVGAAAFTSGVTASSVTVIGTGIAVGGAVDFSASPSGVGQIRRLSGKGMTLYGEGGLSGGDVQLSALEAAGNRYFWEATDATLRLMPDNGQVGIGTRSPATTLDVNGNAQFGSGATKSTFTATGLLQTSVGISSPQFVKLANTGTNGSSVGFYTLNPTTNQSCDTSCAAEPTGINASSGSCLLSWTSGGGVQACSVAGASNFCFCAGIE